MSKNLYANEIASAYRFVLEHNNDLKLLCFMATMRDRYISHSERWSACYDFLKENYPEATGTIVTGLTYYLED